MPNFTLRLVSSIFLILIALFIISHRWLLFGGSLLICISLTWEFYRLSWKQQIKLDFRLQLLAVISGFSLLLFVDFDLLYLVLHLLFWIFIHGVLFTINRSWPYRGYILHIAWIISGPLLVNSILATELLILIGLTAASDIFAYIGGKLIGRHRLAPAISPGKTIEGSIVAILGTIIVAFIIDQFYSIGGWPYIFLLATVVSLLTQVGDIAQSIYKRMAKVKDSSRLIPGHGGIFDRLDGLLLSSIGYYLIIGL